MLKSDFHFDEELIRNISKEMAASRIDEQISHHPELIQQKETLQKLKEKEIEFEIYKRIQEIIDDLKVAGEFLIGWFQNMPPVKRETLKKEFQRASEIFQSEWFQNEMKQAVENPLEKRSPLQKLLRLSPETLQAVYEAGCHLQREGDLRTARSIFRFLVYLNPQVADFWLCLGYCLSILRNYDEAFNAYRFAYELAPNEPNSLYFCAVNSTLQHDYDKAEDYCTECMNIIDGHENLQQWKPTILDLKQFINQKKAGTHG